MARPHELGTLLLDPGDASAAPGVVHQDVDSAPLVHHRLDHGLHGVLVAGVGLDEVGGLAQLFGRGLAVLGVDLRDADPRAFFHVALGDGLTNAHAGARNDCDLAVEFAHADLASYSFAMTSSPKRRTQSIFC